MWNRATDKNLGLTHKRVRWLFDYNPTTGIVTRKVSITGKAMKGAIVGSKSESGYLVVGIDSYKYKHVFQLHRVIWFWMTGKWPESQLDHKNGNKTDNRWENLREATNGQNKLNTRLNRNNTSGVRGVYYHKNKRGWIAAIKGKEIGMFSSFEEAVTVRKAAEKAIYGEFSRS